MKIRHIQMPTGMYGTKCPYTMKPDRIVVHNTANDASAENEIRYMQSNNKQVSFHYAVDDKEVVQGIPLTRNAWHAGDGQFGKGNRRGIAIEICYSKSGGSRFVAAEQNAAQLVAYLLKSYGWNIDRVTKHQDYSGKYCPHRTLDLGWERFLNMVRSYMSKPVSAATTSTAIKKGDKVKVINTTAAKNCRPVGTTYTGGKFVCWYDAYTVMSVNNDRAVIGVAGIITAPVNIKNLQVIK